MKTEIEISELARELLAEAYLERLGEGPYPSYAKLAVHGQGDFTLCSLRAIQRALDLKEENQ